LVLARIYFRCSSESKAEKVPSHILFVYELCLMLYKGTCILLYLSCKRMSRGSAIEHSMAYRREWFGLNLHISLIIVS
jgi:hypothetical protein